MTISSPSVPEVSVAPGSLTVGFWGLGSMGAPMAARLLDTGMTILGFDPDINALDHLESIGGKRGDAESLANIDIVLLMLPNSDIVNDVCREHDFPRTLKPGTLVIDMSSSEPLRTRELAHRLQDAKLRLIDAPVSGGVTGAVNGSLTIMVGGDNDDFVDAQPVLSALGTPRLVGPIGSGHALKALNNLLSAAHLWATSEAMLAGQRFGLDPEVMLETINTSSGRSGSTNNKWPNFILPGTYDSGFGLRLMLKDMQIATDLAHRLGTPISLGDAIVKHWAAAASALEPSADHTEVAQFLEMQPEANGSGQ